MAQYTDVDDGTGTDNTMVQAEFISKGRSSFSKWGICSVCTFSYKLSELLKIKGQYYCTRYKHYLDA